MFRPQNTSIRVLKFRSIILSYQRFVSILKESTVQAKLTKNDYKTKGLKISYQVRDKVKQSAYRGFYCSIRRLT